VPGPVVATIRGARDRFIGPRTTRSTPVPRPLGGSSPSRSRRRSSPWSRRPPARGCFRSRARMLPGVR